MFSISSSQSSIQGNSSSDISSILVVVVKSINCFIKLMCEIA